MKKKLTLKDLKHEVRRLEPDITEEQMKTPLILLAGIVVGANQRRISNFTGIPISYIRPRGKRLRKNGIWVGKKTACEWFDEAGSIGFFCDILVAEGLVERAKKPEEGDG